MTASKRTERIMRSERSRERGTRRLLVWLYRPLVRRAARATLQGRPVDPHHPEAGRFLRRDVDAFLDDTWNRLASVLDEEGLERIPTIGNRHNVFLGALTVAAYHALIDRGIEKPHAMDLFADVGWKIYERMLSTPLWIARRKTRDPQHRMDLTLRWLMRFPFSAPGRPGYEVRAWSGPDGFHTEWHFCAPLGFVQRYVDRHGDRGELDAFRKSWCTYDWPAADLLAGGRSTEHPHYQRPHTLSHGDSCCDMCWSARTCARPRPTAPTA